jgi:hypothetical protein
MQIDMVEISAGGSRIYCTAAYRWQRNYFAIDTDMLLVV